LFLREFGIVQSVPHASGKVLGSTPIFSTRKPLHTRAVFLFLREFGIVQSVPHASGKVLGSTPIFSTRKPLHTRSGFFIPL
jgi:hypothetical protein